MMSLGCLYAVQLQFFSIMGQGFIDTQMNIVILTYMHLKTDHLEKYIQKSL